MRRLLHLLQQDVPEGAGVRVLSSGENSSDVDWERSTGYTCS